MVSVICGTNRPSNVTRVFAERYFKLLVDKQVDARYFSLEQLPKQFIFDNAIFGVDNFLLDDQVKRHIEDADKIVLISPEYNGSFPGVLKAFIDSFHPKKIEGKKAALVGIASGRAGNLRGMDHLTNILHYLKVNVMPNKLPISRIYELLNEEEIDPQTETLLHSHIDDLLAF